MARWYKLQETIKNDDIINRAFSQFFQVVFVFAICFVGINLAEQALINRFRLKYDYEENIATSLTRFCAWLFVTVAIGSYEVRKKVMPRFTVWLMTAKAIHAMLLFCIFFCIELLMRQLWTGNKPTGLSFPSELLYLYVARFKYYFLVYTSISAFAYFIRISYEKKRKELLEVKMAAEISELKLQFLNMQIRPHFIFNAQHTIISLMEQGEIKKASGMLVKLSELLRTVLQNSTKQQISLQEELENIRNYIGLQQIRFGEGIEYTINVEAEIYSFNIPPLLLQPVVENIFHHGFADRENGQIVIDAQKTTDSVEITVSDNGKGISNFNPSGIGLFNTRRRMETYYGSAAQLEINSTQAVGTRVVFKLPLQTENEIFLT